MGKIFCFDELNLKFNGFFFQIKAITDNIWCAYNLFNITVRSQARLSERLLLRIRLRQIYSNTISYCPRIRELRQLRDLRTTMWKELRVQVKGACLYRGPKKLLQQFAVGNLIEVRENLNAQRFKLYFCVGWAMTVLTLWSPFDVKWSKCRLELNMVSLSVLIFTNPTMSKITNLNVNCLNGDNYFNDNLTRKQVNGWKWGKYLLARKCCSKFQ